MCLVQGGRGHGASTIGAQLPVGKVLLSRAVTGAAGSPEGLAAEFEGINGE